MRRDERRIVTLGGSDAGMSQKVLNRAQIGPMFEQAARERVPQPVRVEVDAGMSARHPPTKIAPHGHLRHAGAGARCLPRRALTDSPKGDGRVLALTGPRARPNYRPGGAVARPVAARWGLA